MSKEERDFISLCEGMDREGRDALRKLLQIVTGKDEEKKAKVVEALDKAKTKQEMIEIINRCA